MIDLEKTSGMPIKLKDDYTLEFGSGVVQVGNSFVRTFEEMKPVLYDKKAEAPRNDMYHVYRGISFESDKDVIAQNHLEYDITIHPPVLIGNEEYNKTVGHYHANISGTSIAHPEMYEVLNGKALFLLQKMDADMKNLVTVLAIEASAGEKVIYPPNYGHIIVNIGDEPLVTANWLSTDYKPMYEPIKDKEGMALYVVKGKDGKPTFVKNENYADQPMMRKMDITDKIRTDFGIDTTEPMYTLAMKNLKLLEFLNKPAKYAVQLSALSS